VWAKPTTIIANSCLVSVQETTAANGGWLLRVDGTTHARLMDYDGTTIVDTISVASFSVGTWAHVAGTCDGTASYLYLNGVQSAAGTPLSRASLTTPQTYVGGAATGAIAFPWNGDLAEVALWNVVLTPTEVAQLAAGKSAALVQAGALVAYYKILGTTSPEPDEKGGTALTVTGATAATHPPIDYGGQLGRMFQVF
jgi:hypothetical protein